MPPITLWFTLAVCAGFGIFFTAGTLLALLERRRAMSARQKTAPSWPVVLRSAGLAAFAWAAAYRVFFPM